MKKGKQSGLQKAFRYFLYLLAILVTIVIYAYGFKVTKVNLEETKSERRQTQLLRIIRALAQPDLTDIEEAEFIVDARIMVPCPASGFSRTVEDEGKPYLVVTPSCGAPGEEVTIEGYHFEPNSEGPVNFIPPSEVRLPLGRMQVDADGYFKLTAKLPKRSSDEPQLIQSITRTQVGAPKLSQTLADTWSKIIETIFLALLATTVGTALSIPISFLAARNLMKDVRSPLASVSLNLLAIPLGFFGGTQAAGWIRNLTDLISGQTLLMIVFAIGIPFIALRGIRWAMPPAEVNPPDIQTRIYRTVALLATAFLIVFELFILSSLLYTAGKAGINTLGSFGFIASFFADIGDILNMSIPALLALAGAGILSSLAEKTGKTIIKKLSNSSQRLLTIFSTSLAVATLLVLIMAGIDWLYQIEDRQIVFWIPAAVGGIVGLILALLKKPTDPMPTGMVIYNIARTVLNGLRSIEALIMVIVFVVWVGIGPFAGVLALSLHTIAALAKLYSEQVESIMAGPLEAVTSTGANRLQTIIYAVIPQIIPPYISFTMYRWDINVRMSTIIGFAGGGGIGFLLIQNINLLNYRAASVQMIAIAIVVSAMDYLSSKMREMVV